jgi:hypothetical protein
MDSQRLIQRNKNILNDLLNKQNNETKGTIDHLKQNLTRTKIDKIGLPGYTPAFSMPEYNK